MTESNVEQIVVFPDSAGEWRWRAEAANGEIVTEGEAHTRDYDAARAAHGVLPGTPIFREVTKPGGEKKLVRTRW